MILASNPDFVQIQDVLDSEVVAVHLRNPLFPPSGQVGPICRVPEWRITRAEGGVVILERERTGERHEVGPNNLDGVTLTPRQIPAIERAAPQARKAGVDHQRDQQADLDTGPPRRARGRRRGKR